MNKIKYFKEKELFLETVKREGMLLSEIYLKIVKILIFLNKNKTIII